MITKNGYIKKTALSEYGNPRPSGIIAITLKDDDLVKVIRTDGNQELFIATKKGKAIRFSEQDVRPMGRCARGVRGISLRRGDAVVGMITVSEGTLMTVTEHGYAKRTDFTEYSLQHRGGKGVVTMKITNKTGDISGMRAVRETDEVLMISQQGKLIRIPVKGIRIMGRSTQGVIAMTLDESDKVSAVTIVESD